MTIAFEPDYRNIVQVVNNEKPARLPLYEHLINPGFIGKFRSMELPGNGSIRDHEEYHATLCSFWKDNTYDAFSFEAGICEIYPDHGAILGGRPGPIQNRADFEQYPFDDVPRLFRERYRPHFEAIRKVMPAGMKAYGGCGYGIFESAEDLVGYEYLCTLQYEDPDLFSDIFRKIGDLYCTLWSGVVRDYGDLFAFFRMGDDLGFKNSTLMDPATYRQYLFPQYKRVIDLIHKTGKRFLLHSCGCIFPIMDDLIALGIDAKHSNEDQIAPFSEWIESYGDRIGLFGGIDLNILCLNNYDEVYRYVLEKGTEYRRTAKGFGIGSGNSIPDYVPVESFKAMVDAVQEIRRREVCGGKG